MKKEQRKNLLSSVLGKNNFIINLHAYNIKLHNTWGGSSCWQPKGQRTICAKQEHILHLEVFSSHGMQTSNIKKLKNFFPPFDLGRLAVFYMSLRQRNRCQTFKQLKAEQSFSEAAVEVSPV